MLSFSDYITENHNPYVLGRILTFKGSDTDDCFDALVVRSETPHGAILLVLSKGHPDCGQLINSSSLPSDLEPTPVNTRRLPRTDYFFQNSAPAPIKRVEYHDHKKLKEGLDEDIGHSALQYYQSRYRSLKHREDIKEKLNLIIELLLTDQRDSNVRFI